jgi:hypothetical protein
MTAGDSRGTRQRCKDKQERRRDFFGSAATSACARPAAVPLLAPPRGAEQQCLQGYDRVNVPWTHIVGAVSVGRQRPSRASSVGARYARITRFWTTADLSQSLVRISAAVRWRSLRER